MHRIIIFGASLGGERALRSLPRRTKAVAFCDNNAAKHGTTFRGLPVLAPAALKDTPHERILIASSYYPEIFNQLVDRGVPLDRIDILDPDTLSGLDERGYAIHVVLAVGLVLLGLAAYGLFRLVLG